MSQIDPNGLGASLTDEQKERARQLAWSAVRKFVLSVTGAIGAKLGERFVDWLSGEDEDEEEEET